ncbi:FAD-dependent oxidoreductase [Jiangella muralis]|uniref:FAD-dependent oxidoreductase n=1 Tax=Jiangella muralis TaxID=702383 RepID=UPI000A4DC106|nr:FAD-dependent oxidoreductase [Jiangella muralis]
MGVAVGTYPETPDLYGAFPRLTEEQLRRLSSIGERRAMTTGDVLFREGQPGNDLLVIVRGRVAVLDGDDDERRIVRVHGPGRFLGELSLLAGQVAFFTAVAVEDGELLALSRGRLRDAVAADPVFGDLVLRAYLLRRSLPGELASVLWIIGSRYSRETMRLLEFVCRNRVPHRFVDLEEDIDAEALLRERGVPPQETPVVIWRGQTLLRRPADKEVAELIGLRQTGPSTMTTDVVIVGAGPAGLAAAVYAASEGLDTHVVESSATGGQAGTSSYIENYVGFPAGISGAELAERARLQADRFGARISVSASAIALERRGGCYVVRLDDGTAVVARAVVVASGVQYRRLPVPRVDEFEPICVHYAATPLEAARCAGEPVIVVGGGNSAGQAATFLARVVPEVHLVVREPSLHESMSRYLVERVLADTNIDVLLGCEVIELIGDRTLEEVVVRDRETRERRVVKATSMFVFIGAEPCTTWLAEAVDRDDDGYVRVGERAVNRDGDAWRYVNRAPLPLETSLPGVFAAGDVRSGSVKRIAAAVGDGAMAIRFVHTHLART